MKTITFEKSETKYSPIQINELIQYLKSGKETSITMGFIYDIYNSSVRVPCLNITYTDGTWEWGDDLIYYLKNYPIKLSKEFIMHGNFESF